MKSRYLHIVLSFFLTLSVTGYLWVTINHGDHATAELESSLELEEGGEFELHKIKLVLEGGDGFLSPVAYAFTNTISELVVACGFSESQINLSQSKLYLHHLQLRLDC